jgi:predicted transcriptional regulator
MQIMYKKGLLVRDEREMTHVYSAAAAEKKVKRLMLDHFLKVIYKGYTSKLIIELLGNKKTSKSELKEIKDYLKKMDGAG